MRIDRRRIGSAALTSGLLLAVVFWGSGFKLPELEQFDPLYLTGALICYIMVTLVRAFALRALVPSGERSDFTPWFRLAARHQILFSIAPTGIGDVGFPLLARRYADIPASDGMRIIGQYRLRDALVLGSIAVAGAAFKGIDPVLGIATLAACVVALWFVDDITAISLQLASKLSSRGPVANFLRSAASLHRPTPRERAWRTLLAFAVWTIATTALWLVFTGAGVTLGIGETLLMLAAINAAGAIAISVAGFGVAEAGVAGALVAMGRSPAEAASAALATRPVMLILMIGGCALIDLAVMLHSKSARMADAKH